MDSYIKLMTFILFISRSRSPFNPVNIRIFWSLSKTREVYVKCGKNIKFKLSQSSYSSQFFNWYNLAHFKLDFTTFVSTIIRTFYRGIETFLYKINFMSVQSDFCQIVTFFKTYFIYCLNELNWKDTLTSIPYCSVQYKYNTNSKK